MRVNVFISLSLCFFISFAQAKNETGESKINPIARQALSDAENIDTAEVAKKSIRKMLNMVTAPELDQVIAPNTLSELGLKKLKQRVNSNYQLRYEVFKKCAFLIDKYSIHDENVLEQIKHVAKYDYYTKLRRLAMISYVSQETSKSKRAEFLQDIASTDGELIFSGYYLKRSPLFAEFVRGLHPETKEELLTKSVYTIKEETLKYFSTEGSMNLEVPIISVEYDYVGSKSVVTKEVADEENRNYLEIIDGLISKLSSNSSFSRKYAEGDLQRIANAQERRNGYYSLTNEYVYGHVTNFEVKTEQDSSHLLEEGELRDMEKKIIQDNKPYLTLQSLTDHRAGLNYNNTLSNGVTRILRGNTVKWANNLLERNSQGEIFNFQKIHSDAQRRSCNNKSKFECHDSLLIR